MTEQLLCPCCASAHVEILSIHCNNCGVVVIKDPAVPDQTLIVRPKADRRRTPRS